MLAHEHDPDPKLRLPSITSEVRNELLSGAAGDQTDAASAIIGYGVGRSTAPPLPKNSPPSNV